MMDMKFGLSGRYEFYKGTSPDNMRLVGKSDNIVTDKGLDGIGERGGIALGQHCAVGSGSNTPDPKDENLSAPFAFTERYDRVNNVNVKELPYFIEHIRTYHFGKGVAAGNISEVGVGYAYNSATKSFTTLFSRSQILDSSGAPTTLSILDDEYLDVVYILRLYFPNDGKDIVERVTASFPDGQREITVTARVCGFMDMSRWDGFLYQSGGSPMISAEGGQVVYQGELGPAGSHPDGTPTGIWSNVYTDDYVQGSHKLGYHYEINPSMYNGPIKSVMVNNKFKMDMQVGFSEVLNKTNDQTFKLGLTLSWGRR